MSVELGNHVIPSLDIQNEITRFLLHEAYLLDHRKYEDWLDLLAEDLVYIMPLRVTHEGTGKDDLVYDMTHFDENKKTLIVRVERIKTGSAWSEYSSPRQRHLITNIFVEPGSNSNECRVRSYFLYLRNTASNPDSEQLFGERNDVIRKEDGQWKIASRTISVDQTSLGVMNLSMFL